LLGRTNLDLSEPFADDAAQSRRAGRRLAATRPPGRRSRSFLTLLSLMLVLNLVGLAMVLSASSVTSLEDNGSPWYQFFRQLMWFSIGSVAVVFTMRRDYRKWRNHCGTAVIVVLVMLLLVLVPKIGVQANGATRWLGYGPVSIQPSEIAKLVLIVFWADLLARRAKWIDEARLTVIPVIITFGLTAALIMKQPNLGTTMILFCIMVSMLFVGGAPMRWIGGLLGGGVAVGAMFAILSPWRWARLTAFMDPWQDAQGKGYQPIEAQTAVANGGLTGTGLGQGRSKWGFLPEAHTDFIYSVIAEETGFLGAILVIALFVVFGVVGIRVAMKAPDRFGMLLATGITTWILVQAFLNIGQAVGRLPVMGVPLPFVSSGGSSLVVTMVAAGMLLNVARQTNMSR
jgi:cell division protein FtsW